MAFVPFVETDQPTMAAFNEKFLQSIEEAAEDALSKSLQIETGSYVGTGNSLDKRNFTFNGVPKLFLLSEAKTTANYALWYKGITTVKSSGSGSSYPTISVAGNVLTLTRYSGSPANMHYNAASTTYYYMAITQKEE